MRPLRLVLVAALTLGFAKIGPGDEPNGLLRQWERKLESPDPAQRQRAIEVLTDLLPRPVEAAPALVTMLSDTHSGVRASASTALTKLGPSAVPSVIAALNANSSDARVEAVRLIRRLAPASPETVPLLAKMLTDSDPIVRVTAVEVLGEFSDASAPVTEQLAAMLLDADADVQAAASWALKRMGVAPPFGNGEASDEVVQPVDPLTQEQQAELDSVLTRWEESGERVKKLSAEFTRWEYKQAGKRDATGVLLPTHQSEGELKYFAPDKGLYRTEGDGGEHWVCDGTSIFYYDQAAKQLVESVLPANLQGQRITDGPLPFLFGADAARHRRRYWLRLVTPPQQVQAGYVWIEACPRYRADAATFRKSTMILTADEMLPYAIETVLPNDDRTVHQFREVAVNSVWERRFQQPRLPAGWTHVRLHVAAPAPRDSD